MKYMSKFAIIYLATIVFVFCACAQNKYDSPEYETPVIENHNSVRNIIK